MRLRSRWNDALCLQWNNLFFFFFFFFSESMEQFVIFKWWRHRNKICPFLTHDMVTVFDRLCLFWPLLPKKNAVMFSGLSINALSIMQVYNIMIMTILFLKKKWQFYDEKLMQIRIKRRRNIKSHSQCWARPYFVLVRG